jgi:glycosyltransferase involved in cell wall biosynthesis
MKITLDANRFLQAAIALEAERAVGDSHFEEQLGDRIVPLPSSAERCLTPDLDLSILLPVWNPERQQFMRCLKALSEARLERFSHEILVSDNASDSMVVKECLDMSGLRNVRYVRQAVNIGGFPNFNHCLSLARGRWLHVQSHDDWIEPGFYEALLGPEAQASGADLRFCRCRLKEEGAPSHRLMFDEAPQPGLLADFMDRQLGNQRIQLVSAIVSRRAVETVGGFDARLGAGADWEYWTRVGSQFGVFYHPGELATYVLHQASWSQREGNFEDAESFRKFRRILVRMLLSLPREKRRAGATAFLVNMVQRLLSVALRNKRSGQLPRNRAVAEALLPASRDAGLLPEIELLLASLT